MALQDGSLRVSHDQISGGTGGVAVIAASADTQAVLDVTEGLLPGERLEVAPDADALVELAQIMPLELFLQLRLPHEHDLQELARGGLQGGQDADLLERLDAHLLRLVQDHHHRLALGARGQEVLAQPAHQLALGRAAPLDAEVIQDGAEQLGVRQVGVQDERAPDVLRQLAQERAAEHGLPGAHIADQGHEPLLAGDPVDQGR